MKLKRWLSETGPSFGCVNSLKLLFTCLLDPLTTMPRTNHAFLLMIYVCFIHPKWSRKMEEKENGVRNIRKGKVTLEPWKKRHNPLYLQKCVRGWDSKQRLFFGGNWVGEGGLPLSSSRSLFVCFCHWGEAPKCLILLCLTLTWLFFLHPGQAKESGKCCRRSV